MELILASNNSNKLEEVRNILKHHKVVSLKDLNDTDDVEENGSSFKENAYLKAKHFYDKYHKAVIADDSGLVVEVLKGQPGILSARYSGVNATSQDNNLKLLKELKGVQNKNAYFICVICYIDSLGNEHYFEGKIHGQITEDVRGSNGFGYDPIFYLPKYNKTFAELGSIKNEISHRAIALSSLNKFLNKEV